MRGAWRGSGNQKSGFDGESREDTSQSIISRVTSVGQVTLIVQSLQWALDNALKGKAIDDMTTVADLADQTERIEPAACEVGERDCGFECLGDRGLDPADADVAVASG